MMPCPGYLQKPKLIFFIALNKLNNNKITKCLECDSNGKCESGGICNNFKCGKISLHFFSPNLYTVCSKIKFTGILNNYLYSPC